MMKPPNLVYILSDDQRGDHLRSAGHPVPAGGSLLELQPVEIPYGGFVADVAALQMTPTHGETT